MNRWVLLVVLFIAASWSLLLLPWVSIGEGTLTGTEISDLLTLLPALAILMLLISLYGRLARTLRLMSAGILGFSAYLSFSSNFAEAAASIAYQESITGVAGENSLGSALATAIVFAVSQLIASIMCLALLRRSSTHKSKGETLEVDARGLWESQG